MSAGEVSSCELRVRQVAAKDRRTQFTSLFHHLTRTLLTDRFYKLKRRSTPGVDGLSWQAYAQGLDERLARLLHRLHSGSYRPTPARRIQIPKADGSLRPLSIQCVEDKWVQHRIKDKRLIRLLTHWMKVGHYDEDGRHVRSARGVPQGGI